MTKKRRKPLLKVGAFYERQFGYQGRHRDSVYISSAKDHGSTYSYHGTTANLKHPEMGCDCGRYYWEDLTGSFRDTVKNETWRKLSRKESILAASKLQDTDIRKKFGLPVHPRQVDFRLWLMHSHRSKFNPPLPELKDSRRLA